MKKLRLREISLLDRVHEHVLLPPVVVHAIDTPQVQRLRGLKQLGASSFLYPGAVHTRFEHSIGVAHMARTFLGVIQAKQPELGISQRKIENVMLAGLCHDLGHGPFSHLFEDVITKRSASPTAFCHEKMSKRLAQQALKNLISSDDVSDVLSLMSGKATRDYPYGEVISNKRNGVDVDRLDYFLRDSVCCFGKPTVDVRAHRLFHTAMILQNSNAEWVIAFEEKMAIALRELFALRAKLHKQVYQHHVTKAIGHMIGDVFTLAEPCFRVCGLSFRECCEDENAFLALGDWILDAIEYGNEPGLREAQSVLQRLRRRELYKMVACHALSSSSETETAIRNEVLSSGRVESSDFIVDIVVINHGQGDRDPLQQVPFFNPKRSPRTVTQVPSNSSPLFCPQCFEERSVMIFERRGSPELKEAVAQWVRAASEAKRIAPQVPFFNPSE